MAKGKVRALYAFSAQAEDELSFQCGDVIDLEDAPRGSEGDEEWLFGCLQGQKGAFPANYVQPLLPTMTMTNTGGSSRSNIVAPSPKANTAVVTAHPSSKSQRGGGHGGITGDTSRNFVPSSTNRPEKNERSTPLSSPNQSVREEEDDDLPDGWYSVVDPESGGVYYYDDAGEATWEKPTEPYKEAEASSSSTKEPLSQQGKGAGRTNHTTTKGRRTNSQEEEVDTNQETGISQPQYTIKTAADARKRAEAVAYRRAQSLLEEEKGSANRAESLSTQTGSSYEPSDGERILSPSHSRSMTNSAPPHLQRHQQQQARMGKTARKRHVADAVQAVMRIQTAFRTWRRNQNRSRYGLSPIHSGTQSGTYFFPIEKKAPNPLPQRIALAGTEVNRGSHRLPSTTGRPVQTEEEEEEGGEQQRLLSASKRNTFRMAQAARLIQQFIRSKYWLRLYRQRKAAIAAHNAAVAKTAAAAAAAAAAKTTGKKAEMAAGSIKRHPASKAPSSPQRRQQQHAAVHEGREHEGSIKFPSSSNRPSKCLSPDDPALAALINRLVEEKLRAEFDRFQKALVAREDEQQRQLAKQQEEATGLAAAAAAAAVEERYRLQQQQQQSPKSGRRSLFTGAGAAGSGDHHLRRQSARCEEYREEDEEELEHLPKNNMSQARTPPKHVLQFQAEGGEAQPPEPLGEGEAGSGDAGAEEGASQAEVPGGLRPLPRNKKAIAVSSWYLTPSRNSSPSGHIEPRSQPFSPKGQHSSRLGAGVSSPIASPVRSRVAVRSPVAEMIRGSGGSRSPTTRSPVRNGGTHHQHNHPALPLRPMRGGRSPPKPVVIDKEKRAKEARERVVAQKERAEKAKQKRDAAEVSRAASVLYKECRTAVYPPKGTNLDAIPKDAPESGLRLEYVYGYNGDLTRYGKQERYLKNVLWLHTGEIIFPASSAVVIYNFDNNEQRFYLGHDDDVMALARHPTSDVVASGQAGRPARIACYDASIQEPALISTFAVGKASKGIVTIDFSPDGEVLLVSSEEDTSHTISVWDWKTGHFLAHTSNKSTRFHCIHFNPYCYIGTQTANSELEVVYTMVSGASRQIKFWTLTIEEEPVEGLDQDKDSRTVMRRQKGGPGYVYRLESNGGIFRQGVDPQDVLCMCFVMEGGPVELETQEFDEEGQPRRRRVYALTGTDEGAIHVWTQLDAEDPGLDFDSTEGLPALVRGTINTPVSMTHAWIPKGRLVSVVPNAHEGSVLTLTYCASQHTVASCGKDGLVILWTPSRSRTEPHSPLQVLRSVQLLGTVSGVGAPRSIDWSDYRAAWVVGSTGSSICLLRQASEGNVGGSTDATVGRRSSIGEGGTGNELLEGRRRQSLTDSNGGLTIIPLIRGHTGRIRSVTEHPTLPLMASIGADKTLRIWDAASRRLVYVNRLWDKGTSLAFHPHGATLAVGTEEGEVIILECGHRGGGPNKGPAELRMDDWKISGRRGVPALMGSTTAPKFLPHSNATKSVIGNNNHPADMWATSAEDRGGGYDLTSTATAAGGLGGGASTTALVGSKSKNDVIALRFSPDGHVLAAATRDKQIHLLMPELNYRRLGTCRGHCGAVVRLDFSRDGRFLQSNDTAREILYWEVATAKQIRNPSTTRDLTWDSWTALYGWPVQGVWGGGAGINANGGLDEAPMRGSQSLSALPVVSRSHDERTVVVGDIKRVRLFRYPCLKGAAARSYFAHSSALTGVTFLADNTRVISAGGSDLCIYQWKHQVEEGLRPSTGLTVAGAEAKQQHHQQQQQHRHHHHQQQQQQQQHRTLRFSRAVEEDD